MKYSIEIFPPRTPKTQSALKDVLSSAAFQGSAFVSVTCGAGGDGNADNAPTIRDARQAGHTVVSHVVCGTHAEAAKAKIAEHVADGVQGLLCLRGDAPVHPQGFPDVIALIKSVRAAHALPIFCAGYPDPHPLSQGADADLDWIRKKRDAGAEEIITQYCFDPDVILKFRDAVARVAPDMRVRPGVLPVKDVGALVRFSERCGAIVPESVINALSDHDPASAAFIAASTQLSADLINRLSAAGVGAVHVYALNEERLIAELLDARVLSQGQDFGDDLDRQNATRSLGDRLNNVPILMPR